MGVKELLAKMFTRREEERLGYQRQSDLDLETRDNYLRSLRRQRQKQFEEQEKERLIKEIKEFEKAKTRKYMWGIKDDNDKAERIERLKKAAMMRRKIDILHQKNHYKLKKAPIAQNQGFFDKGNI